MDKLNMVSSIALRVQGKPFPEQAIILARLAEARSKDGYFVPRELDNIFVAASLPRPKNIPDVLAKLRKRDLLTNVLGRWRLTPLGRHTSLELVSNIDLAAFSSESIQGASALGNIRHTIIPPELAPPQLVGPLQKFLDKHPFETNVFGICRFPRKEDQNDPIEPAIKMAREVCKRYGLQFHLASDRAIVPDLWENVAAHIWASQHGIAFFENTVDRGLNYNLTIEVGSMLITGRNCVLLKDASLKDMPTDLVGKIYHNVDLNNKPKTVELALIDWIKNDLSLT